MYEYVSGQDGDRVRSREPPPPLWRARPPSRTFSSASSHLAVCILLLSRRRRLLGCLVRTNREASRRVTTRTGTCLSRRGS